MWETRRALSATAGRRRRRLLLLLVPLLELLLGAACDWPDPRILQQNTAMQFLSRRRRANAILEETKKGNLERECIEELCNKEEAREIFENQPETDYFYPKYVEISDQCTPLPCYKEGYEQCIDGQASFTCECRPGWKGLRCEEDIDECTDLETPAGCNQKCHNLPGSFRCACEDGYFSSDKIHCKDINECLLYPSICKSATCINTPGMYECRCPEGYGYNFTTRSCEDVDECAQGLCEGICANSMGSFSCHCDGRKGWMLAENGRLCQAIPVCVELNDYKDAEMLYLGEQFAGLPVIFLRFRLPKNTRFAAEFDFRTFDPEGVILYAESSQDSWFMLGLRDGKIEVQFKNQHSSKVTSGGKAINDGEWHVISVDELEHSISVKISKEAVMSINSPEKLFTSTSGVLETKLYIAGLPNRTDSVLKPINPRLDGCIRGWNLMNQGASGVKEVIKEKTSKHCFVQVERGSYFPGFGLAQFHIGYGEAESWKIDMKLKIRPSSSTGVIFALVSNNTVPLSVSVVTQGSDDAELKVFIENVPVATLHSLLLCYPGHFIMDLLVSDTKLQISANSSNASYAEPDVLQSSLSVLNTAMQGPITTYIGGVPDLPVVATPVTAFFHGCMEVIINGQQLDFDEAVKKHNSIKSHSCPRVSNTDDHLK